MCKFIRSIPAMLVTRTSCVSPFAPGHRAPLKLAVISWQMWKVITNMIHSFMVDWWFDGSIDGLLDRWIEWVSEWVSVVGWLTDLVGDWLTYDRLTNYMTTGWLTDWLTRWLAGWLIRWIGWLIGWLIDWLIHSFIHSFIIDYISQP